MGLLCRVRNIIMYVQLWRTLYGLTPALCWYFGIYFRRFSATLEISTKITLVSALALHHSSIYIILYVIIPNLAETKFRYKIFIIRFVLQHYTKFGVRVHDINPFLYCILLGKKNIFEFLIITKLCSVSSVTDCVLVKGQWKFWLVFVWFSSTKNVS